VVERVIARWQPEHERKLRQIVANMQEAASHNDSQLVYEEDYNFHHTLWEIADHSILIEVVSGLRSRINHFLYQAASTLPTEELSEHVDGHYNLIELFQQGDIHLAQQKIDDHITRARDRILLHCNFESSAHENMD
jgi:DNA-binding GntR family transcriptional regulator